MFTSSSENYYVYGQLTPNITLTMPNQTQQQSQEARLQPFTIPRDTGGEAAGTEPNTDTGNANGNNEIQSKNELVLLSQRYNRSLA